MLNGFRPKLKDAVIIFPFHARLDSGLDYAVRTVSLLSVNNTVVGIRMGEPITWRNAFYSLRGLSQPIIHQNGAVFFRPIFILPGMRHRVVRDINYWMNIAVVVSITWLLFYRKKKIIWFFEPFHIPSFFPLFAGFLSVYDCVDYFPAFTEYARQCHEYALRRVDFVFANSYVLTSRFRRMRQDVIRVPVGFSQIPRGLTESTKTRKPSKIHVGYVGGINDRLNYQLLFTVISSMPDVQFSFVGDLELAGGAPGKKLDENINRLFSYQNVRWVQGVRKNNLGNELRNFSVCIIPYDISNPFNRYCYPMKFLEYCSFRKPILSTPIRELSRHRKIVCLSNSDFVWRNFIAESAEKPYTAEQIQYVEQLLRANSWEQKVRSICCHISK